MHLATEPNTGTSTGPSTGTAGTTATTGGSSVAYAHWLRRAAGYLIDIGIYLLPFVAFFWVAGWQVDTLWYWIGVAIALPILVWNMVVRQGRTGYTVGKQLLGIRLLSEADLEPIGPLNSFVRLAMHQIVDQLSLGLGYLWPWWDGKRQTFADKVMRTIVVLDPYPGRSRDSSKVSGPDD